MGTRFHCPRHDCQRDKCPAKKIFSCLTSAQDAQLGKERLARRYEAGQVVIHFDTPALAVHSVHSGRVKLVRATSNGNDVVVSLRGPGELLGVREVLSGMPHQTSAETLEPSVICAVPREAFLEAVRGCPDLAMRLLHRLATDHLVTEDQLVTRTQAGVTERIARLLMALADGDRSAAGQSTDVISMSREEMALLVGIARETLSRSLRSLADEGVVRLENGSVRVVDRRALERLAEP